jgi:hypothetical protein
MGGGGANNHAPHLMYLPDDVKWETPQSLPPGAKVAMLEGDMAKRGFFTARAWLPDGYRIPPHWHPNDERITVLAGTFYLGEGETFDQSALKAMPPGTYSSMPPGMRHFAWTKGETIIQISTIGPWGINYVNPDDDPRKGSKGAADAKP